MLGHLRGCINRRVPLWQSVGVKRGYASVKTTNVNWNPMKTNKQLNKGIDRDSKKGNKIFFALLCIAPFLTFALGTWQVKRLKWKNKLIAECEDRLIYKPIAMPKNLTKEDLPNLEYRKVLVKGHFDYSREVYVGPRLHDGRRGYTLVCPFVQSNGDGEVLIDRGWISADKVIPQSRNLQHLSVPKGEITVECVIRVPPVKGIFNMDHEKGIKLYQYLDADAMADDLGTKHIYLQALQNFHDRPDWLINEQKYEADNSDGANSTAASSSWKFWNKNGNKDSGSVLDEIKVSQNQAEDMDYDTAEEFDPLQFINAGVPLGKIPKVDYKNNHLNYLVTWYSLSVASAILLIYMFRTRRIVNPTDEKIQYARKIID